METGIGATLREARNRRKVDLAEVEAATKIRVRFLRAMENEEWDVLPGGAYTRGFIRTYAGYLGLDGERLAEDFRRGTAPGGGEREARRVEPVASAGPAIRGPRIPGRVVAGLVSLVLVGAAIAIGLTGGDDDGSGPAPAQSARQDEEGRDAGDRQKVASSQPGVAVRLAATGEVWVCLLDAAGEALIDGQILEAGAEQGPFRSDGFTVSFGNGAVTMLVDGREADLPVTSSPIGYEIGDGGELRELDELERPTCA